MLKVHIRRTLFAAIIAGLLGFLIAYRSPKIYEAIVEVMAGSPALQSDQTMPIAVRKVLGQGFQNDLDSDTGIIRSQRIFTDGLRRAAKELGREELATGQSFQELYPMFDLDIPASLNAYAPDQTRVVKIRVRAHSADDAASIANNVASAFADYRKQRSKDAVHGALEMEKAEATKAKLKLDAIDAQFRKLKVEHNIVDIQANGTAQTEKVQRLLERKSIMETNLEGAKAELASLQIALARTKPTSPGIVGTERDQKIGAYIQVEAQAKAEYNTAKETYADDSPIVVHAKEKLDVATKERAAAEKKAEQIKTSTSTVPNPAYLELVSKVSTSKAQVDSFRESLAPLAADIQRAESEVASYPAVETKFFELSRNRLVYEDQYEKSQKFVEELQNSSEGSASQIQNVVEPSQISDPVAPDPKKYIILAAIVGSLIGLAYSFAMESFKLPVHTSWQLAELTALPVAASIPMMPKPLARRHYSEIRNADFKPIESFRYMAFSMMAKENRPGVILFSAVGEDVDSTGAAAEFAVAMAKTGSKVALVDCDLRVPRLSELFGVQGRSGVAEILGRTILPGESTDLFVTTEHDNLMILPAGAASASGLSDFNTSHMSGLIEDLREKADMVVINCPPVDVFADASRLAQYVDEVCMVISAKTTSYRAIPVAQEILHKSGAKEMSIVLTNGSPTEEPFGSRTGTSIARR